MEWKSLPMTSSRTGLYSGTNGCFLSPIPIGLLPQIVTFRAVLERPQEAQEIPAERSVVRLILITSAPLEVVTKGAVDVAMGGDSLFPVPLPILGTAVSEVDGDFKKHGVDIPSVLFSKLVQSIEDEVFIASVMRRVEEEVDALKNLQTTVVLLQTPVMLNEERNDIHRE